MDTQAAFGFQEMFNHLLGGMAKALCQRDGEASEQQYIRSQTAVHLIMAFSPRDAIEAMLAGRCVMFHELIVDSVGGTLRGDANPAHRAERGNLVAMDRAFGANLTRLERYQRRQAEGQRDGSEASARMDAEKVGETDIADRTRRHQAASGQPSANGATRNEPHPTDGGSEGAHGTGAARGAMDGAPFSLAELGWSEATHDVAGRLLELRCPSRERIAECRSNPKAVAAMAAGDPAAFARAMGVDNPTDAYIATAKSVPGPFTAGRAKRTRRTIR